MHIVKFTNHRFSAWWFFRKQTHLCNQHPDEGTESWQEAASLPVTCSRFCDCAENLFLPAVTTMIFQSTRPSWCCFSCWFVFTGSTFMVLVPPPEGCVQSLEWRIWCCDTVQSMDFTAPGRMSPSHCPLSLLPKCSVALVMFDSLQP